MTLLGGAVYAGFFGLAAIWLALTADRDEPADVDVDAIDQTQVPERSNSANTAAASVGSMPC